MRLEGVFVDTNLLVLLVIGLWDESRIGIHNRTRRFTRGDFAVLLELVSRIPCLFVTPNTLTEASNLLEDKRDPRPMQWLRELISRSKEVVVSSRTASTNKRFVGLGLTDTVLLAEASSSKPLITDDLDLYSIAAGTKGYKVAYNFNHLVQGAVTVDDVLEE